MANLNIKVLSKIMGAEITGVDLSNKIDKKITDEILKAITNHLVVCIRDQNLNPKQLVNVSK